MKKKKGPGHGPKNEEMARYLDIYTSIEKTYISKMETFGLPFHKRGDTGKAARELRERLRAKGAIFRNNDKSICTGALSSACEACAKGDGCMTIYISLMCNHACYYCINPNQEDYDLLSHKKNDWRQTMARWLANHETVTHLALSGGEPLLHKEDALDFFRFIQKELSGVHTRLYTAGDLLDSEMTKALAEAGLREIRFSIKLEDDAETREKVLKNIAMAKQYIPDVMVEMPVIPGTGEEMRTLLKRLDEIGIRGINLLEFCFPLHNTDEFLKRGFELKYPPFDTLYNYWYAGGLAVDGSEKLSLELMEFALDQKLSLGVHYCSLENKHTGQIYMQNAKNGEIPATMLFSDRDYFIKTAKVFGADIPKAIQLLEDQGVQTYEENEDYGYLQFHPEHMEYLSRRGLKTAISYNVLESRAGEIVIRELRIEPAKSLELS